MNKSFQLQAQLDAIYGHFPEAKPRPLIGISANTADIDLTLRRVYCDQIVRAGGVPVVLPPVDDAEVLINMLEGIDGLVLTGGADYNPLWYGEQPEKELHTINSTRDLPELLLTRLAFNRQIPILGICRGVQTMAIALGGNLVQDLKTPLKHSQDAPRSEATHSVTITEGSTLYGLYGQETFVNSFHHQAVKDCGSHLHVVATAPDGVIEAVESTEQKALMGVQWHPEWMGDEGLKLFEWLTQRSREFKAAKALHREILTLDSHCDTPMFFPQGVHFKQRDPKVLYDLHKMTDGKQDAVTMVAYLPQHPKPGELPEGMSPRQYADSIFDQIEAIVAHESDYVALARTPQQLYENKAMGKKSIMLGIENGLAIEDDIRNIAHFAQRGIVYITLCHNGDNAICDSARGTQTHGGVSAFGEQVIGEMNRLGVMVDLSHGAETSFFDALSISQTPIVCSHSNCKALCDVPRNLTDAQLKALAQAGGVAQITLYHGFLRKEGEADIRDAMAHLNHAIDVMGIDHVGLGTDFDGDGGIKGLADASELINFTTALLRQRFSKADIKKIWGENWLRVMRRVQAAKHDA
ncbi:Zn-dependent dipeptidase, dipeptidase homolog [Segatella oulorum]|uniref:Zn-dependent dipeptidase, dipeptidase homolog n=1 Tax=Segatella oulorum TaxID=28136 RepID=A0A1T4LFC9_9BACT|nr:membrane dipeptidase [Segatella oulorum]SJZ53469.1 Zn-dependent dipeptidase, dipeptidase homolog [Segatella oulorum]